MANPMSGSQFTKAVRSLGIDVIERPGWLTHNRNHKGPWGPVHGVMHHHTVTRGTMHTVEICEDGYTGLPGPLCHGVIAKAGTLYMVGWGRANHAGLGDDDVLRAIIPERALPTDDEANTDGNRHFYGFESENMGDGKDPWPRAQLDTMAAVSYVIANHHGWTEKSTLMHSEWQPGKTDPRGPGFTADGLRADIRSMLRYGPGSPVMKRIRAR